MGFVGWAVLLICVLLGVMLLSSVHVIALRTYSRYRLVEAFKHRGKAEDSQIVDRLAEYADRLILACALCRWICSGCVLLLLAGLFQSVGDSALRIGDYIVVFLIAAALFSTFGLAIPHAWAKYAGERILSRTYILLFPLAVLTGPVVSVLRLWDGLVRRLVGVREATEDKQQEEKQEEFLEELEQHRMEGAVDEEEQEMIENVLELSESRADEIMTPRTDVVGVEVDSDLPTVLETITRAGHSRVPVYEQTIDKIVGLVYAKDLLTEIGKPPQDFKLRDKMRPAYFVPETKPLRALLHEFQNQKLHFAVLLDEYGGTAGIVTLEDILEELVGEITDEYEQTPPESVREIDETTLDVDARTYIDDLNDKFELNLPEDADYDTIGGFVFSQLGYVPKAGEVLEYENLKFTIASAEPRRVKRVRIHRAGES